MIDFTAEGKVGEIVLDLPETNNALSEQTFIELSKAYTEAAESGIRALIFRATGKDFCPGRDLTGVEPTSEEAYNFLSQYLAPVMRQMSGLPFPTFAAVQGRCLGVGFGLLAATDVVYVADDAQFGSATSSLGAISEAGAHHYFLRSLGTHRALDLIYTGDLMSGKEAVAAGLFSRAVPAEKLLDFTREKAARVAKGPTLAFHSSKKFLNRIREDNFGFWDTVEREANVQSRLALSEDYVEGITAAQQGREPNFKGR